MRVAFRVDKAPGGPRFRIRLVNSPVSAAKGLTSAAASVRPRPPAGDNRSISAVHLKTPSADYGVFR